MKKNDWHKYPEEKPTSEDENKYFAVTIPGSYIFICHWYMKKESVGKQWKGEGFYLISPQYGYILYDDVIAYMKIEPYKMPE